MKVLVANLGSTSFKYRLFDMSDPAEPLLARGAIERIGSPTAKVVIKSARGDRELVCPIADHGEAVQLCLDQLTDPEIGVLSDPAEVAAIGFKAVHARNLTGVHLVDETVLAAMEAFADVAPAHNPPYTKAMRMLRDRFPRAAAGRGLRDRVSPDDTRGAPALRHPRSVGDGVRYPPLGVPRRQPPLHRDPDARAAGAVGHQSDLVPSGGSSSLCAIRHGQSVACSLGMSPQTGLPHNNRVGDFDVFALPAILRETGKSLDEVLSILANQSGLEGLSGAGCDLRDIEEAAAKGNARAELAIDVFVAAIRHFLGAYLLELNGADAIVFTGGIGENSVRIRTGVCRELDWFGIELDPAQNQAGPAERVVSTAGSRVQVWTVPTNEEIVVARQSKQLLEQQTQR